MSQIKSLFILTVIVLVVAACGPTMVVPTATQILQPTPTLPSGVIDAQAYGGASTQQTLTLHLPEGRDPSALVLFVPYGQYFTDLVSYFTDRGYPVVTVNMRSDLYLEEIDDLFCALAFVHTNAEAYGLDLTRIVPIGLSFGGGAVSVLAAADDPDFFLEDCIYTLPEDGRTAAVITLAGVLDFSFEEDFYPGYFGVLRSYMQGTPDSNPEVWQLASAITHIDGSEPPFLLLHGTADVTVAMHQSQIFAETLQAAGGTAQIVFLPDLDHEAIFTSEEAFAIMEDFLAETFP